METLLKEPKYSIIPISWKIWYFILSQFNAKEYYEDIYQVIDSCYYYDDKIEEEFSSVRLCDVGSRFVRSIEDNLEDRYLDYLIPVLYRYSVCKSIDVSESIEILTETDINQLLKFVSSVIKAYEDNYDSFVVLSDSSRNMLATVYDEFRSAYHIFKCVENIHGYVDDRDDVKYVSLYYSDRDYEINNLYDISFGKYAKLCTYSRKLLYSLKDLGKGISYNLDIIEDSDSYCNEKNIEISININKEHGISAYAFLQMLCYGCCKTKGDIDDLNIGVHWDESYEPYKYYKYQIANLSFEYAHICKDHHYESSKFNDNEIGYFKLFVQRGIFDDAIKHYRHIEYEKFNYRVFLAQITNNRSYKLNILNRCLIDENKYLLSNFYEYYHKYIKSPFSFYDEVAPSSMKEFEEWDYQLHEYRRLFRLMDELDSLICQKSGTQVNSNRLLVSIDSFLRVDRVENNANDFYSYTQYLYSFYLRLRNDIYEKLRVRIEEITNQNNIYINYISDIIKNEKLYTRDSDELEIQKTDFLEDEKESLDSDAYVSGYDGTTIVDNKKSVLRILEELSNPNVGYIRYEEKEGKYYVNVSYHTLCEYLISRNYIYIMKGFLKGYVIEDLIKCIRDKSLRESTIRTIRRHTNWDIIPQLKLYKPDSNDCLSLRDTRSESSQWSNHMDLLITLLEHYKKEESGNR